MQRHKQLFALDEITLQRVCASLLKEIGTAQGMKFHGFRTITVYVYTGQRVTLRSPWFVSKQKKRGRKKAGPNGRGSHVGLDLLGFVSRGSGKFVSWVVKMAILVPSYEIAREVLLDRGIRLAVNTIRRFCRELGRIGIAGRGKISLDGSEDLSGKTLVIEVDGGRLRLRRKKRGRKKRHQKRQGYQTNWKEPKLFTMYLTDAQGQIVKEFLPIHDATTGDDDEVFALMAQYLNQLDLSVLERVVVCGDGARWIWLRVESLLKNRGVASENLSQVVDYTHAKQNLQEIIELVPLKKQKRIMKKWEDYFVRNTQRMQYQDFQRDHLPCGSGHVESAIRRVINLRLKAPGTFWTKDMAEYFLFLRSQLLSGRWKIFMKNVRRRLISVVDGVFHAHNGIESLKSL